MLELGTTQTLKVIKKVDFGVYLAAIIRLPFLGGENPLPKEKVLLPKSQIEESIDVGDTLRGFLL